MSNYCASNGRIEKLVNYADFAPVFKVFEEFPFFESWKPGAIREEFDMFMKEGEIFGYYLEQKCVGIVTLIPHKDGKYPVAFKDSEKVMYLSDIAVLPEYRRKGIAGHLFHHVIVHSKVLGYDKIYLRTNKVNSMSYGIAVKCGFTVMEGIEQEVEMARVDGTIQKDTRIFLEKIL